MSETNEILEENLHEFFANMLDLVQDAFSQTFTNEIMCNNFG